MTRLRIGSRARQAIRGESGDLLCALRVQLDHVAVWIGDEDLLKGRLALRASRVWDVECAQVIERLQVAADAQREVAVAAVDLLRLTQRPRRRMDDQMQLLCAKCEPGSRKVEVGTRKLGEASTSV